VRRDPPPLAIDWALFLDIDGTLVELAATPDAVIVPPILRARLAELRTALRGALALVSGRSLARIDELFAPFSLPAAGQHGAELRLGNERLTVPPDPRLPKIVAALGDFAATRPGILVENKGDSVALHYRAAPQHGEAAWALATRLVAESGPDLEVLASHMAIDIKSRAVTKGSAIGWFMERAPFFGRVPAFLGDDRTDEAGFAAVNERGGTSIRVGEAPDSVARFRLRSPAEVLKWLGVDARRAAPREP
jgi:trehalose 6-phosphate phosphatase